MANWDFGGYATRNDLECSDGRIIRKDAFKVNDGCEVPLIWDHKHHDPNAVLGHAVLENRDDGVYAYGIFNDSEQGKHAKQLVQNGDIRSLSIWANQLKQVGSDVIHGCIKELSLVVGGANPGAYVDYIMAHGADEEDTLYASYDENIVIYHSADNDESKQDNQQPADESKEEKTVQDVIDTMNEEQKKVMAYVVSQALEENGVENKEDKKEDDEVKHNVF